MKQKFNLIVITTKDILPKVLGSFLVIFIALIAIIFSIHADVFSSYDKHNTNSKPQYDWFNISNVINFPYDQYEINIDNNYPKTILNLNKEFKDKKTRKVTIILDRTGSLIKKEKKTQYRRNLKEKLLQILYMKVEKKCFNDTKFLKVEDLFLLTALSKISDDATSFEKTIVQVVIYTGFDLEKSKKESGTFYEIPIKHLDINEVPLLTVFKDIIKELRIINKQKTIIAGRDTNFSDLAEVLSHEIFLNRYKYKNYNHKSLIILSDFVHEEESGAYFYEVVQHLGKINNLVNQVNLVSFNPPNIDKIGIAKKTKNIFRKTFNDLYFYEFEEYLNSEIPNHEQINRMFSSTIDDTEPLILYHSFNNESYKYDYAGQIKIENLYSKSVILNYGNRIKPNNYVGEYNYLKIKNKNNYRKIYPFQATKIDSDETYEIHFTYNGKSNKNIFLELNSPEKTKIIRKQILLRPVLPKTSCIYLICLYFLANSLLITISIYYITIMIVSYCTTAKKNNGFKVFIIIPLFFLIFFLFKTSLIDSFSNLFAIQELKIKLIVILISLFIIPLFIFSYNSKNYIIEK
ncbi:hypothetical protein [uncultured Kordia sp.]|uniref:hypothetical protein n=1 Tax=uncultured Kordia sp. TaxID=507699 RepID=UPI0026141D7E|nr:hypothetical protein [uncultured Kordia sp.]